jgi:hypothetical protein
MGDYPSIPYIRIPLSIGPGLCGTSENSLKAKFGLGRRSLRFWLTQSSALLATLNFREFPFHAVG